MRLQILFVLLLVIPLLTRLFFYQDSRHIYKEGEVFELTYSMNHEPRKNERSQYFFVDSVMITFPLYPAFSYGDKIHVKGLVEKVSGNKGDLLIVKNPEVTKLENKNPLFNVTKFIRQRVEESVTTLLPEREAGLLLGIILGVRDKIDGEFYQKLRSVGVLHVVAASGQNVSIIAGILLIALQKIVKRKMAILFTMAGILFYAVLSGFDPPIVRASLMAIITFGAMAFGRQTSGVYALMVACWGMVMWDPSLLSNTSFHLSVLSTWGILTIKPILDNGISVKRLIVARDDITTTISAQIATFPIMILAFGTYSLISIPVNLLVLWTVPVLMIGGGVAALLSLILPQLSIPVLLLTYPILAYFTFVVELFSRLDYIFTFQQIPQLLIFGYYLILFGIVIGVNNRGGNKS